MDERRPYWAWTVSSVLHGALLALILLGFASAPRFEDSEEAIPVETVSATDVNQIMEGEKTAKPAPAPKPQPEPTQTPPAQPPEPRQAQEPPRPLRRSRTRPLPRQHPSRRSPRPSRRPEPPKELAEDAPEPPVRPKEKPPEKPPEKPERPKPDQLAKEVEKALAQDKTEPKPKPKRTYDPNAIAKLLDSRQQNASAPNATGSATPQGLPHHNAPKMSMSMAAALDAWLTESYLNCWTPPPGMPEGDVYVAQIKVVFNPDGSLSTRPVLLNPPGDAAWRAHADSAMRAVRKCDPLHVPPQYAPYFEEWRVETIHFDPRDTQG